MKNRFGSLKALKMLPKSTFVLGGAASGKSLWAENFLLNSGLNPVYVATGRAEDGETQIRVERHRARRDARWRTVEAPLDLAPAFASATQDDALLIDCATMWLTNQMMADADLNRAQAELLELLREAKVPWVIVSNEVGHGIVPDNALARQFREAQGRLNIALADLVETAVMVVAGLPLVLKGAIR